MGISNHILANFLYPLRGDFLYPRFARIKKKNIVKTSDLVQANKVLFLSLFPTLFPYSFPLGEEQISFFFLYLFPFKRRRGEGRRKKMRPKNYKGSRCTKRKLKKCEEIAKTYDKVQTAYKGTKMMCITMQILHICRFS